MTPRIALAPAQPAEAVPETARAPDVAPAIAAVPSVDPKDRRGPFRPERLIPARSRLHGATVARLLRAVDFTLAAFLGLGVASTAGPLPPQPFGEVLPFVIAAGGVIWALISTGAYNFAPREGFAVHLSRTFASGVLASGAASAAAVLLGAPEVLDRIALWTACAIVGHSMIHLWVWTAVRGWRASGRLSPNIVVVGATENAARLIASVLESREANVLAIFDDRIGRVPPAIHGVPVLGDTKQLLNHPLLPYIDRIIITVTSSAQVRVRTLIERLKVLPNAVTLFVDVEGQDTRDATLSRMADMPLTQVSGVTEDERRAAGKRVQDLVFGSLAMLVALPIMGLVAVAIRLDSPGPVFFRQRRHGFNNEPINVWKFRSMRHEAADAVAAQQVRAGDDRVTKVGRFIRRTSLDELPQLFNVLAGEMSLVGPRPHAIGMKTAGEESARLIAEYAWRHRMKPGMSGWAQINGSVGPIDTPEAVRRRVTLDIEYIERQSFWFDLRIMVMTIPALIAQRNIVR